MKTQIYNIEGKKLKELELPSCFSSKIRYDIISRILETKKNFQPYGPSPVAGKQHSASGKIRHRRHVWKSGYGKGISRVPRKITSRRGSQFNWIAAEISSVRGGRRAHPPKPISMVNTLKVNKKEFILALVSAISATANKKEVSNKYKKIEEKDIKNLPVVVETKITSLKTKNLLEALKKILGEKLFNVAIRKKSVRGGKGKLRGRKYKVSAGALLVLGKEEKLKTNILEVRNVQNLNLNDLAKGGSGRLVIYTEQAIKNLKGKFLGVNEK